jgi:phage gp36-like protein
MAYCTLAAMLARHNRPENPELTQITAIAGAAGPDEARITQALDEASGQMDLYLGTRHTVPLSGLSGPETEHLAGVCADIARYRLWDERASDEVRRRYEDAIQFLQQAAAGRIRLGRTEAAAAGARATVTGPERQWTRDKTTGIF